VDKVEISVVSGSGGDGFISFRREKFVPLGGPDGGDGGNGGSLYIRADRSISTLSTFRHKRKFKAEDGTRGGSKKMSGKRGDDLVITVPPGTVVQNIIDDQISFLADLQHDDDKVLVAKGGKGGRGNMHFATPTNQAPKKATAGRPGEEYTIILDLKLIADVGIIGFPNAGKSTLLAAVSAANPKTGDYPFTTLEPVLGKVMIGDTELIIAEIPGLIEGAHTGKGLGFEFLRHAERTRMFIHVLDGTVEHPENTMNIVNSELGMYNPELIKKPQLVAINKIDIPAVKKRQAELKELFESAGVIIHFISGVTGEGVADLMSKVAKTLNKLKIDKPESEQPPVIFHPKPKIKKIQP
jgi:GTPase